jgi:hypothetical protein
VSRFIFLSFAFLGWAFYEVSGGPDFQPRLSAALAAVEEQRTYATPLTQNSPPSVADETYSAPSETGLIVTRMIVADETVPGRGVTTYSMTNNTLPHGRKLTFSLPAVGESSPQIRRVLGSNVNMRTGPGTQFVVVDNLPLDSRVKLLDGSIRGWVKLRSLDSGRVGWIQRRFISTFSS